MAEILLSTNSQWSQIAILILRLMIGSCFVIHGLGKLGIVGPGNMDGFVGWLKSMNLPFAKQQAQMAMLSEIIGGAFLALGLFTRPACFILFATMTVAALIGHKGGGYLITNDPPGNEYVLNLMAVLVAIFLLGPGVYSLDAVIW